MTVELALDAAGLLHARTSVTNTADGDLHLAVGPDRPARRRRTRPSCSTSPVAGARNARRSGTRGCRARTGATPATAARATTRPSLMVAGTPGFSFGTGEVWAVHTAWSGNHTTYAERTPEGECLLGGGELLDPGEVVLAPGETYDAPRLLGSWSGAGLDAMSHRFHAHLRAVTPRARDRAARDRQHRGRRSTSTTPSTGSPSSPTWPPRSGSSASSSTTAGSSAAATTPPGSATGRSTRPSGRRAWGRWSTT